MGTGSSKAHRWRASRRGNSSGSIRISISSAPAGQGQPEGGGEEGLDAPAATPEGRVPSRQAPPPAAPEPDWDAELLDQMLTEGRRRGGADGDGEEEEEEEEEEEGPRLPPRLPAGPSTRLDAGDSWPPTAGGDRGEGPPVFLPRTIPESSKVDNEHPLKDPERQGNITYDYSEEELMASIEQEYCR